jgi:hypothetical protein
MLGRFQFSEGEGANKRYLQIRRRQASIESTLPYRGKRHENCAKNAPKLPSASSEKIATTIQKMATHPAMLLLE